MKNFFKLTTLFLSLYSTQAMYESKERQDMLNPGYATLSEALLLSPTKKEMNLEMRKELNQRRSISRERRLSNRSDSSNPINIFIEAEKVKRKDIEKQEATIRNWHNQNQML